MYLSTFELNLYEQMYPRGFCLRLFKKKNACVNAHAHAHHAHTYTYTHTHAHHTHARTPHTHTHTRTLLRPPRTNAVRTRIHLRNKKKLI